MPLTPDNLIFKQGRSRKIYSRELEVKSASHLALVEIVFGSVGHGFKIPFAGTFLSYYQLYILLVMMIRKQAPAIATFNTSVIVALLKTLSPLGKKITPMIAIFMQGFLLWLGTTVFGGTLVGMMVGSALFVSWSLVQIAIGYTVVYGLDFFRMIEFFQKEMSAYVVVNFYFIFIAYWVVKIVLAETLLIYLVFKNQSHVEWSLDEKKMLNWRSKMISSETPKVTSNLGRAGKDLVNPFFFLTLALMILFHFFQKTPVMDITWFTCRTLALSFLLFYLLRSDWLKKILFFSFGKNKRYRDLYKKMYFVKHRLEVNK